MKVLVVGSLYHSVSGVHLMEVMFLILFLFFYYYLFSKFLHAAPCYT